MGAKYNFSAAFLRSSSSDQLIHMVTDAFSAFWDHYGPPKTVLVQNVTKKSQEKCGFNIKNLRRHLPPDENTILSVYPLTIRAFCLILFKEGRYLCVTAAIDEKLLNGIRKEKFFEQLKQKLLEFDPCILVAGEELDIDERFIDTLRIRSKKKNLQRIDHCYLAELSMQ